MSEDLTLVLRRNMVKALAAGDLEEAGVILERLQGRDSMSLETRGLHLELLIRSDRLADAEALARQLLDLHPRSARVHLLAGQLAARRKDYPAAIRLLRESLKLHPSWKTERLLGQVLTHHGNLEEAEAILISLLPGHAVIHRDLAWLAERQGRPEEGIRHLEAFLEAYPDVTWVQENLQRLKARTMEPEDLQEEVDSLMAFGEEVAPELVPEYVESLLKTGQGNKARAFLAERASGFSSRIALRSGWVCYKLQAFDLAFELFLQALPSELKNFKLLTALESAAARCHRTPDLLRAYESHAPNHRPLDGRIRRLTRE